MENVARKLYEGDFEMMDDERYYTIRGRQFDRTVKYTIDDLFALPDDWRVELIDGVFYDMASPSIKHQRILRNLSLKIGNYINAKGGKCEMFFSPCGVKLHADNDRTFVEPDILVVCDPDKIKDRWCVGAPDWIIEVVSPGNPGHDYIKKLKKYKETGVREYWIVDPMNEAVTVYDRSKGELFAVSYKFTDIVKVGIYDDLFIDFNEISADPQM